MNIEQIRAICHSIPNFEELIETHISWLILSKDYVWKLKKPMKYSFLDFSELEQRSFFCEKEVQLNQRLSPEMYLSVEKVCDFEGKIQFSGTDHCGNVIDFAVKMRRMDRSLEMDSQLVQGKIELPYIELLARKIAHFHLQAEKVYAQSQGNAASYQSDFNDIWNQKAVFEGISENSGQMLEKIIACSNSFLAAHQTIIKKRLDLGYVRDVHGDLHARNIFAYPSSPVIFDCIEFNDHFRQIDVLNEIAFFCMDLEAENFESHSKAFLNAYLEVFPAMPTKEAELLFIWFKCYRANVRAKVNALRYAQTNEKEKPKIARMMIHYLDLMQSYAKEMCGTI